MDGDAELVHAAMGTREPEKSRAYRCLVDRYWPAISAKLRRWVACPQTADDLAQDAFIKAFQRLPELREPVKFGPWLFLIGQRLAQDWFRRRGAHVKSLDALAPPEAAGPAPSEAIEEDEGLTFLVSKLKPDSREVLILRFRDGLAYGEIAQRLGIPDGTAAARLHRALQELKTQLASRHPTEVTP